jgi:succinate dehydrogenase hydrophobic anchor subunit
MIYSVFSQLSQTLASFTSLLLLISAILHLLFASGVARDIANLNKMKQQTQIVPGYVWVIATAIGGIFVMGLYWFMHHSKLAK